MSSVERRRKLRGGAKPEQAGARQIFSLRSSVDPDLPEHQIPFYLTTVSITSLVPGDVFIYRPSNGLFPAIPWVYLNDRECFALGAPDIVQRIPQNTVVTAHLGHTATHVPCNRHTFNSLLLHEFSRVSFLRKARGAKGFNVFHLGMYGEAELHTLHGTGSDPGAFYSSLVQLFNPSKGWLQLNEAALAYLAADAPAPLEINFNGLSD